MHRARSAVLTAIVLLIAAAAVAYSVRSYRRAHPGNGPHAIAMDGTAFSPDELTVHVGDTVEWTNKDPFPHNVTFRGALQAHSGDLDEDGRWSFRPTTAGTFPYVCTLHPGMKGVLHVQ